VLKTYADLTKFGIVVFSVITGLAGYATGFLVENPFDWKIVLNTLLGIYFLSSGSLALNQVQEWKLDQKMPRTAKRPIAAGKIKPAAAGILALGLIAVGMDRLFIVQPMAAWVGLVSMLLYNGPYTMWWKRRWAFAAVPGAIPGALPVTIGYAAANPDIYNCHNGARFSTYVIKGGKGEICLNGAAARHVHKGDLVIIVSYCGLTLEEAKKHEPSVVFVDEKNRVKDKRKESSKNNR
jgi:hypothetical protein